MDKTPDKINAAISSSDGGLASHYALHVALQTMKERCQSLQQRLLLVEEDNLNLRLKLGSDLPLIGNDASTQNGRNEMEMLTERVSELTRQKFQLTEHIAMVATENRQLWSRLSKLAKNNQTVETNSANKEKPIVDNGTVPTHQNLIRSKTFTQNAPNPILRQKINVTGQTTTDAENLSLEEISLKVLNEFIEGKAEIEKKCNEILSDTKTTTISLGFGYFNDDLNNTTSDSDLQSDIKKSSDVMIDIKKEMLRQQSDLKVALSSLRQRRSNIT